MGLVKRCRKCNCERSLDTAKCKCGYEFSEDNNNYYIHARPRNGRWIHMSVGNSLEKAREMERRIKEIIKKGNFNRQELDSIIGRRKSLQREEMAECMQLMLENHHDGITSKLIWETFFKERCSCSSIRGILAKMAMEGIVIRKAELIPGHEYGGTQYLHTLAPNYLDKLDALQRKHNPKSCQSNGMSAKTEELNNIPNKPPGGLINLQTLKEIKFNDKEEIMMNILERLDAICRHSNESVSANTLQEKFFPQQSVERVSELLGCLEDIGKVGHENGGKNNNSKRFFPVWLRVAKNPNPVKATKPYFIRKKVMGETCEVCAAFIGVKAHEGLLTVDCAGCGSTYLSRDGWLYRLGPGIKMQVWAPVNENGNA